MRNPKQGRHFVSIIAKDFVIQKDVSVILNAKMLRNSFNFSIILS